MFLLLNDDEPALRSDLKVKTARCSIPQQIRLIMTLARGH